MLASVRHSSTLVSLAQCDPTSRPLAPRGRFCSSMARGGRLGRGLRILGSATGTRVCCQRYSGR
eukprot:1979846-Prymnesium_polylepis.1